MSSVRFASRAISSGNDRLLPPTQEGDVLLIATAGAYGRAMSSTYNLREPAIEVLI